MTSPSLADSGQKLLAAITQVPSTARPSTVADVVSEVIRMGQEADRLARELPNIKTPDASVAGALHRLGAVLRDTHTAINVARASLSDDLKKQLGIAPKKATP
jgi:hypothetical protein